MPVLSFPASLDLPASPTIMVMSIHVHRRGYTDNNGYVHSCPCRVEWRCPFMSQRLWWTDKNAYLLLGKSYPQAFCRVEWLCPLLSADGGTQDKNGYLHSCPCRVEWIYPFISTGGGTRTIMDTSILILTDNNGDIHSCPWIVVYTLNARWVNKYRKSLEY